MKHLDHSMDHLMAIRDLREAVEELDGPGWSAIPPDEIAAIFGIVRHANRLRLAEAQRQGVTT